jgi:hypothetical protein
VRDRLNIQERESRNTKKVCFQGWPEENESKALTIDLTWEAELNTTIEGWGGESTQDGHN